MPLKNQIVCGDCLEILPKLPKATMIFADPPDNIGVKYGGYSDRTKCYDVWMRRLIRFGCSWSNIFWLSFNSLHLNNVVSTVASCDWAYYWRLFFWHYTFGQNRQADFVSSYRPIIRMMEFAAKTYPDAIRVPSARQTKYHDKRANPKGKMPDDVWEFPRVCGTFKERKKWHPCQHPKELLKRMVLFSTKPGDLVIDMFAGSGNMFEVCEELDRRCIGIEVSRTYCDHIKREHPEIEEIENEKTQV